MDLEWVSFVNPGSLNIDAIRVFGLTAKPGSDSPIGQFGTGLKYAISTIIRTGGELIVETEDESYSFTVKPKKFRGKEVFFIHMNNYELPFTTELGKNWQPWQAYRELAANAIDEGGATLLGRGKLENGFTRVSVLHDNFPELFNEPGSVFLDKRLRKRFADDKIEVYDAPSKRMYYRGIRVADLEKPSMFTYNFLYPLELTEDRTFKEIYWAKHLIMSTIIGSDDASFIKSIITSDEKEWFEGTLDFDLHGQKGERFIEVLMEIFSKDGYMMGRVKSFFKRYEISKTDKREVVVSMTAGQWKNVREDMKNLEGQAACEETRVSLLGKLATL